MEQKGVEHGTDCSEPIKCCLCGGSHIATDQSCPKWVRQLKICEIRTEHQVGYSRASEILRLKESTRASNLFGDSWGPTLGNSDSERIVNRNPVWVKNTVKKTIFRPNKTSSTISDSSDEDTHLIPNTSNKKKRSNKKPSKSFKHSISNENIQLSSQRASTSFNDDKILPTIPKTKTVKCKIIYMKDVDEITVLSNTEPSIIGFDNIAALIKCIGKTTTVTDKNNRPTPVYSCKLIAEELTKLTEHTISADFVYKSFI